MEKRDVSALQSQLDTVSAKLVTTKERLADTVAELEALKVQAASNARKLTVARQQNERLSTERCALQKENDKLKQYTGKIEVKLALAAQQSGLANAIEKQSALEKQLTVKNGRIAELENIVKELKKEVRITADALAMKEEDWGLRPGGTERSGYKSCADVLKTSLLRTVATLKHEADAFQLQLAEEERRANTLQAELLAARTDVEALTVQRADAQLAYDQLQIDYEHLMEHVSEETKEQNQIDTLRKTVKTQGRELKEFTALFGGRGPKDAAVELNILRAKLDETERMANDAEMKRVETVTRYETLQAKMQQLEKVRAEGDNELTELRGRIVQLSAELGNYKQLNHELYSKLERYAGYADVNTSLLQKLKEYEVEIAKLNEQKADLQRALISSARANTLAKTITTD